MVTDRSPIDYKVTAKQFAEAWNTTNDTESLIRKLKKMEFMNAMYLTPAQFINAYNAAVKYNLSYHQLAQILTIPKAVLVAYATKCRRAGCPLPRLRRGST